MQGTIGIMTEVIEEKDVYLANFSQLEKELGESNGSPLHRLRTAAMERFRELGFPGLRNEDWKFTTLAPLAKVPFQPARLHEDLTLSEIERFLFATGAGPRLVFVNGFYAPKLSQVVSLPDGVVVTSLAKALQTHPEWVEPHLARYADYEESPFTALNTAFLRDGACVLLAPGQVFPEPIQLVFISTAREEPTVSYPRNLIVAGRQSQATIVESYLGLEQDVYFTNAVTEVVAGPGAVIDYNKLLRESFQAFHIQTLHVHQERDSRFSSHTMTLGGALVRNEIHAVLDAEGCECTLNGLYLASGRQHIDNHTVIDHARPHCASHELYKGILDGQAHGVFNGKIFVRQDAQKTDAKQTNQTLLLSEDAVINTKPQLEIYADDVKCTHGATVGQLDEESIFYLRSRGIGREEARRLLTFAFANDIIGRIQVEAIRDQLEKFLLESHHLSPGQAAKEVS